MHIICVENKALLRSVLSLLDKLVNNYSSGYSYNERKYNAVKKCIDLLEEIFND